MFENAVIALDLTQQCLDACYSNLKAKCSTEGKFRHQTLDDYQLLTYELAFCAAEKQTASQLIEYAQIVRSMKGAGEIIIEERQALFFAADCIHNIRGRILARSSDFGIDSDKLNATISNQATNTFCAEQLATEKLVTLGKAFLKLNGSTGASILDKEKEMMRDTFRQVADDIVAPLAEDIHRNDLLIPEEILKPLAELGCFGLSIPLRYGGIQPDEGEDNLGMIVVTEELSRGSLGGAGSLITRPEILARALMKGGTEEQRKYWLPKLAEAKPLCAVAVTEPNYGSDVASMKLRATRVEGGWTLNGNKTWCTMAGKAGVLLTLARTNPDPTLSHKGLTVFLVEKPEFDGQEFSYTQEDRPVMNGGTITGKAIPTIGYRGMHSFDVFFDDFFVADANVIGGKKGVGQGFYTTMTGFSGGRIQTAARATGVMQAAYEKGLQYSQDRIVFGKSIAHYQLTLVKIARMGTLLNACRQMTYSIGRLMDKGEGNMEASLVKLFACKSAEWICREALQIHGGMGYAEESDVSRYYIDARVLSIFEGAEETLALKVIGRSLVENAL